MDAYVKPERMRAFRAMSMRSATFSVLVSVTIGAVLCFADHVVAATVTSNTNTVHPTIIFITGEIDSRTVDEVKIRAKRIPDWGMLVLNSNGGDVLAALEIGRIVRARNFETDVAENSTCASACIFILAAGVDRSAYGRIGIHRPHFDDKYFAGLGVADARNKYNQLEDITRNYLHDMGMPGELFREMMNVPSDEIVWLTPESIHSLGLDRMDPGYEEWLRAQYAQRFGPEGYRRHIEGLNLLGECLKAGDHDCEAVWPVPGSDDTQLS